MGQGRQAATPKRKPRTVKRPRVIFMTAGEVALLIRRELKRANILGSWYKSKK